MVAVPAPSSTEKVGVLNWRIAGALETALENSDVSRVAVEVAVAVTNCPSGSAGDRVAVNTASPAPSVVTVVEPIGVWPSPTPDGSDWALPKNWIRNVVFGVLLNTPW